LSLNLIKDKRKKERNYWNMYKIEESKLHLKNNFRELKVWKQFIELSKINLYPISIIS